MPKVLVVAETKNGELKKPTLELLSLAKSMNLQAESVLIGKEVSSQADLLAGYGSGKVYVADDAGLEIYNTSKFTTLVADAVGQSSLQTNRGSPAGCKRFLHFRLPRLLSAGYG